jgi:hypothetical protein
MSSVLQFCLLVSAAQLALSSPVYFDKKLQEAEQIALESTGFLFPIDSVVRKIMRDLKSIRSEFTEAQSVVHRRKWIPGEVLVRGITDEQINMIEKSQVFGPLEKVKKFNFGSLLVFAKAYNPERLSERLMEKFGLRAEPNTSTGDAFTATGSIKYNPSKGDYTIEKGPGGISYPGYSNKAVWEFGVTNGKVNLKSSVKPGFQIVRKI